MGKTIDHLRTLEENSGQIVYFQGLPCYFLWFYSEDVIEVEIISEGRRQYIEKKYWDNICLFDLGITQLN